MSERKDRTILIVSIIVVVGLLVSLVGGCLGGGLAGYLMASRQIRDVERRLDEIESSDLLRLPQILPEAEELLPLLPELLERYREGEFFDSPEFFDRFRDLDPSEIPDLFDFFHDFELPEMPEFDEELQPMPLPSFPEQVSGAWIREVVPGAPADEAGLLVDDVITVVDGQAVDENHPLQDLVAQYEPGDRVQISYVRGGEEQVVTVTLGEHPDDSERAYLGVYFIALSIQQRFERDFDYEQPRG